MSKVQNSVLHFAQSIADLLTQPDATWGGRAFDRGVAAELAAAYIEELLGWAGAAEAAAGLFRVARSAEAGEEAGIAESAQRRSSLPLRASARALSHDNGRK